MPAHLINGSEFSSLPTPTVSDTFTDGLKSSQQSAGSLHSVSLAQIVHRRDLLPTPMANSHKGASANEVAKDDPKKRFAVAVEVIERNGSWGKFAPAIEKWEQILGRPAPSPTKPDGKNGAPRLSAEFSEFMMGLPQGWVTGCGLSRTEAIKACGNGVVPQQAKMALEILLDGVEW